MDFFYMTTSVTIGDGGIAIFWHTLWLHGLKPKDIATSIFSISSKKNFSVKMAWPMTFGSSESTPLHGSQLDTSPSLWSHGQG
jgi:hypothetical protein